MLTGMGRDGAEALLELRKHGARTAAQDEETSLIDGMPKAARQVEVDVARVLGRQLGVGIGGAEHRFELAVSGTMRQPAEEEGQRDGHDQGLDVGQVPALLHRAEPRRC